LAGLVTASIAVCEVTWRRLGSIADAASSGLDAGEPPSPAVPVLGGRDLLADGRTAIRAPVVRHSCASETGNNRIQPENKPHGNAKCPSSSCNRIMWIIVYTTVYIL
jgi:hypothetical protein